MAHPPSAEVLAAFGLSGIVVPVPGGRGLCYRVGDTILKPCDDIAESQWLSQLSAAILRTSPTSYRLAIPMASLSDPNSYAVNGWAASSFVSGVPSLNHFPDVFRAANALHADLAKAVKSKPAALANRAFNRFDEADNVAWGEKSVGQVERVNQAMLGRLQPILDQLSAAMRPLPGGDPCLKNQLVHMDLLGNVLIEKDKPPGIIDLTFYWRPAAYALAVVVADGLTRLGSRGPELVELYLQGGEIKRDVGVQLLVRALYWRYLTFAIDPDLEWVKVNLPQADYAGAAGTVCGLINQP